MLKTKAPEQNPAPIRLPIEGVVRPIGDQTPTVEGLFLGALLWSTPKAAVVVLDLVHEHDFDDPFLGAIAATVRTLAHACKPIGAAMVVDALRESGAAAGDRGALLFRRLTEAATNGAEPIALTAYAAAVVAAAYRRAFAALGTGLIGAADEFAEQDLMPRLVEAGARLRAQSERLAALRGGDLG